MAPEKALLGGGLATIRHIGGGISITCYSVLSPQGRSREHELERVTLGAINKEQLLGLVWVAPSGPIMQALEKRLCGANETVRFNGLKSWQPAFVRDTLLPRPVSCERWEKVPL